MNYEKLLDLAGGDPGRAEALKEGLEQLARGTAGPELREMANDVLNERIDLHKAVAFEVYANHIRKRLNNFMTWYDALMPAERKEILAIGREYLANLRSGRRGE